MNVSHFCTRGLCVAWSSTWSIVKIKFYFYCYYNYLTHITIKTHISYTELDQNVLIYTLRMYKLSSRGNIYPAWPRQWLGIEVVERAIFVDSVVGSRTPDEKVAWASLPVYLYSNISTSTQSTWVRWLLPAATPSTCLVASWEWWQTNGMDSIF